MVCPGTRFLAVTLMDQFMDRHSVQEYRLKLLASACLLIAGTLLDASIRFHVMYLILFILTLAKLEDLDDRLPTIDALLHAAQTGPDPCTYSREEFRIMEMYTLKFFMWHITFASPAHFSGYFLKHFPDWAQGVAPSLFPTSVLNHADYLERRLYLESYTDYFIELGIKGISHAIYNAL